MTVAGLRRRHVQQHGLPGHASAARWRRRTCPFMLAVTNSDRGHVRLRQRDRQGRRRRQQGRHRERRPATRSRPSRRRRVHDPAADAVRADRQRDRRRRRRARLHAGSRTTAAAQRAPRCSATRRRTARCSRCSRSRGRSARRDTLQYNSPGENHLTTSPTRVFPDLQQILDNNTNADTGACPTGPDRAAGADPVNGVLRGVPADVATTSASPGVNASRSRCTSASPRATARAATSSADTTLLLASRHGPVPRHRAEHRRDVAGRARRRP